MRKLSAFAIMLLLVASISMAQNFTYRIIEDGDDPTVGQGCDINSDTIEKVVDNEFEYICDPTTELWIKVEREQLVSAAPVYGAACDSFKTGTYITSDGRRMKCVNNLWAVPGRSIPNWHNIEDYGGIGTDVLADDDEIALMIADSLAGDTLYFPAGNWYITAENETIKALNVVCDAGATFIIDDNDFVYAFDFHDAASRRSNMKMIGCSFLDPDATAHESADQTHPVRFSKIDGLIVEGFRCRGFGDECIDFLVSDDIKITNFDVEGSELDSQGGVLGFNQCSNVHISNGIAVGLARNGTCSEDGCNDSSECAGLCVSGVCDDATACTADGDCTAVCDFNGGSAIKFEMSQDSGDKSNISISNVTASAVGSAAITFGIARPGVSLNNVNISNVNIPNTRGAGVHIIPTNGATMNNVNISNVNIAGGGLGATTGGGIHRGAIDFAEGVRTGSVTGGVIDGWGIRESECVAVDNPAHCCTGVGTGPTCTGHAAIRIAEDGVAVSNVVIRNTLSGITTDSDRIQRCSGDSDFICNVSRVCLSGTCDYITPEGNSIKNNTILNVEQAGIAVGGPDSIVGNLIDGAVTCIQLNGMNIRPIPATGLVQANTVKNCSSRAIGVQDSGKAISNLIMDSLDGVVMSGGEDRCETSTTLCSTTSCTDDGTCVANLCSGGWNTGNICQENDECEDGTCVVISSPWDYENVKIRVANLRTNSADVDAVYREAAKYNVLGSAPTVTDDVDKGYSIGSRWIRTLTNDEFVCTDNTAGAAVWTGTSPTSVNFVVANDLNFIRRTSVPGNLERIKK